MSPPGETIVIDLRAVRSEAQLMDALGEALELGGPNGNVLIAHSSDGKGWGKNWDALLDSLSCLDTGGIWGTSRKLRFPLRLTLKNASAFRRSDKESCSVLLEVLEDARARYAKHGLEFAYEVDHDA